MLIGVIATALMNRKCVKISVLIMRHNFVEWRHFVLTEAFKNSINLLFFKLLHLPTRDYICSKLFFVPYLWNSFTDVKVFIMSQMLVLIPSTSREWSDEPAHTRSLVRAVAAIKHRVWNYGIMLLGSHHFFTFKSVILAVKTRRNAACCVMRVHTAC